LASEAAFLPHEPRRHSPHPEQTIERSLFEKHGVRGAEPAPLPARSKGASFALASLVVTEATHCLEQREKFLLRAVPGRMPSHFQSS